MNQRKSDFVASVSHEFKNPLTVIDEALAQVLEGIAGNINDRQKDTLSIAKNSVGRLIRLVTDLLDVSKIEAGKMELKREKVIIRPLLDEIIAGFQTEISQKQLNFKKEVADDVDFVWADRDRVIEVIVNLLSNAMKYTPSGGEIGVKVDRFSGDARFEIFDNGPGIASQDIARLFDKFERVTRGTQEGTGLGLAIAKDIVKLHRGKIWVESELGKGSRFIFILPRDLRRPPPFSVPKS
jgi:signal transduction histidine kinase